MIAVRPEILLLHAYVPGKSMEEIREVHGLQRVVKLASNENPLGPSPLAMEALTQSASQVHLYPRGDAPQLVEALARRFKHPVAGFLLGNGSDEVLSMIAQTFVRSGDHALACEPTFSIYRSTVQLMGGEFQGLPLKNWCYDLEALYKALRPQTRVVYICNPNNPTGTSLGKMEILEFIRSIPLTVLVVVDQAYCEYATGTDYPDLLAELNQFPNLILVRTFSKIWGLAGMRVGYALGAPALMANLQKVKPPFNVSLPAQNAALAALDDHEHLQNSLLVNGEGMARLRKLCEAWGYATLPSQANFLAICTGERTGEMVAWMESCGMIVRWLKSFGMPHWIRVTVGTPQQLDFFVECMQNWRAS